MAGWLSGTSCTGTVRLPLGSWHLGHARGVTCKRSGRGTRSTLETGGTDAEEGGRTKVWAVALVWGWDCCLCGGAGLGSTGRPGKVHAAPVPAGWLETQPRCRSTAASGRREGQVRAAASGRAARRGLRLAGGLGWGCGRAIISELGSVRWCRGRGDGGRRSRSAEWGCCSWGCLNCSAPCSPRRPRPWRTAWAGGKRGAVTPVACCSPAGRAALLERAFAGKGPWMAATARAVAGLVAGRERQQSLGFPNQHGPAARRADPTGAHAHPLSLPPSANHLPSTNTASSSRRWLLRHLE